MYEICTVAGNEVIRAFHKGRIYFALFLNLILIKQLTDSISSFSVAVKVRVTPWVFPFFNRRKLHSAYFHCGNSIDVQRRSVCKEHFIL